MGATTNLFYRKKLIGNSHVRAAGVISMGFSHIYILDYCLPLSGATLWQGRKRIPRTTLLQILMTSCCSSVAFLENDIMDTSNNYTSPVLECLDCAFALLVLKFLDTLEVKMVTGGNKAKLNGKHLDTKQKGLSCSGNC
ncbi:hypothetical protein ACJX0J_019988 [Zea mays]